MRNLCHLYYITYEGVMSLRKKTFYFSLAGMRSCLTPRRGYFLPEPVVGMGNFYPYSEAALSPAHTF